MSDPGAGGTWRAIALVAVAAAGVAGTLVVGAAMGVGAGERSDLLVLLVPAGIVTRRGRARKVPAARARCGAIRRPSLPAAVTASPTSAC